MRTTKYGQPAHDDEIQPGYLIQSVQHPLDCWSCIDRPHFVVCGIISFQESFHNVSTYTRRVDYESKNKERGKIHLCYLSSSYIHRITSTQHFWCMYQLCSIFLGVRTKAIKKLLRGKQNNKIISTNEIDYTISYSHHFSNNNKIITKNSSLKNSRRDKVQRLFN